MLWNTSQVGAHRGIILSVALASVVVVQLPKYLAFLPGLRGWALPFAFVCCVLEGGLPFFLRRIVPKVADFDSRWLPFAGSQWLWFLGMVLLLVAPSQLAYCALSFREDWDLISLRLVHSTFTSSSPTTIVLRAVVVVLLAPIAEEIFWRAYLLAQLKKLTHWSVAIAIQALLFAFAHLPNPSLAIWALLYGTILGCWRIRFKSLLPLIVAHVILNGVVGMPHFIAQYGVAVRSYPKCHKIDLLTGQPAEKAMPVVIEFLSDPDDVVSTHALEVLGRDYRSEAKPYLKEALEASDNRTVDRALFAIDFYRYSDLKSEVRAIVWSPKDLRILLSATCTLHGLKDDEGLTEIAHRHPDERVRHAASNLLRLYQDQERD